MTQRNLTAASELALSTIATSQQYLCIYTAWNKRQYLVWLPQALFCRALWSQLNFHRWVSTLNTPDWSSSQYPGKLQEGATDAPVSFFWKASVGVVSSAWTSIIHCFQQTKTKSACMQLAAAAALQNTHWNPQGCPCVWGRGLPLMPLVPVCTVPVCLAELSLGWGPIWCTTGLWTEHESLGLYKDLFQPRLGLGLQILLFVQPSCTYSNEWHLHGTILQHPNWPIHSVPCH